MKTSIKILLSIGIVIVAAGAVVGLLYWLKPTTPPAGDSGNNDTSWRPNTSQDYGACSLVSKPDIEAALEGAVDTVYGPDNLGYFERKGYTATGAISFDSQSCIYPFAPGASVDNVFQQYNGLIVTVNRFKSQADASLAAGEETSDASLASLGQHAAYTASQTGDGAVSFKLSVLDGMTQYQYEIKQPADSITLADAAAKAALITIAQSVK